MILCFEDAVSRDFLVSLFSYIIAANISQLYLWVIT